MEKRIRDYLKEQNRSMTAVDLMNELNVDAGELSAALLEATREGRLLLTRKGKYALPEQTGAIPARALVLRSGVPIARPLDGSEEMRIVGGDLRAMNGDLILVRRSGRVGERAKCDLVSVTERANDTFTAVLFMDERKIIPEPYFVRKGRHKKHVRPAPYYERVLSATPFDTRILCRIDVEGDLMGAKVGDAVVLKVIEWQRHKVPMRAQVTKVLGAGWNVRTQLIALTESHDLPREFSAEALRQAEKLPREVRPEDVKNRADARNTLLFTIDGADARDFDDAVSLEKTDAGWLLGVHIADVSHYVRKGSPIDRDARERGTSVYLPGMVLPMLPEALSNNLCSLMPQVDRLALTIWLTIENGEVVREKLERTVIHSSARLTYEEVNKLFLGEENNVPEFLHDTLRDMLSLSHTLRRKRHARGSIDFELAEPHFTLDESGMPVDVCARERGEAEKLIEDFMLLANETVAKMGRMKKLGLLYRVHEEPDPDRLHALEEFLQNMNHPHHLGRSPAPMVLQHMLEDTASLPEAAVIRQLTLRSLKRACYDEQPLGHYGLAAKDYCHFTSPIRRYPDLAVHRALCAMLSRDMDRARGNEQALSELALHCSDREYAAVAVERDADDLIRAYYMKNHIGEEFEGVVSGVQSWGFYVALPNTVEGLVHVRTIEEHVVYVEEKQMLICKPLRLKIRLGDSVRVKLDSVNVMAGTIDFVLVMK